MGEKHHRKWPLAGGTLCSVALAWLMATSAQSESPSASRDLSSSSSISLSTPDRIEDAAWWPTKGAAARNEYVGTSECEICHAGKVASQMQTAMAKASTRAMDLSRFDGQPRVTFRQGRYDYELGRIGNTVTEWVTDGHTSISQPLLFAFGQGVVGHTFLYEREGHLYESHLSYYSAIKGLDITTGHPRADFADLSQALGRPLDQQEAKRCFGCHSTASTTSNHFDPSQAITGVTCEACHGPGARHVRAMEAGQMEQGKRSIVNPGNLDPASSVDFCGACHRTSGDVILINTTGVVTVRFQPFRLEQSRCWKSANKRLTCVTCHDPHKPLVHDVGHYDQVCIHCHSKTLRLERRVGPRNLVCKVSQVNCANCHMPKIEIPGMHHAFADHWIRIAREHEPYPN